MGGRRECPRGGDRASRRRSGGDAADARGPGIGAGRLASIRERREHLAGGLSVLVVRPLLGWRRGELRRIAEDSRAPFVDDPSNADERFDRTRFRGLLEANPWLDAANIARSAAHLAEAERALLASADMLWDDRAAAGASSVTIDMRDLPRELRRRLARAAIARVRECAGIVAPEWSDASNIEPLLDALEAGGGASQAGVMASAKGDRWRFRPAPPRRSH